MGTCATPIVGKVWIGRDNVISMVLFNDGTPLDDLSGVTRVTVDLDGGTTVIDSDTAPVGTIWWTDTGSWGGATVDLLRLQLGGESITAGVYTDVEIVIYDATYPDGLRLESPCKLTVIE